MRFVETVLAYLFAPLTIFLRIWDHLQGPTIPLGALGLIAALLTMVAIVSGVPVNGVLYVGGLAYLLTLFFYNRLGEVHVQHVETKCMVASLLAGCALTWMIFVFVLLI